MRLIERLTARQLFLDAPSPRSSMTPRERRVRLVIRLLTRRQRARRRSIRTPDPLTAPPANDDAGISSAPRSRHSARMHVRTPGARTIERT